MCVCHNCTPSHEKETHYIIYRWIQNLSGRVFIIISNPSNLFYGRYCPETGHDWKKRPKMAGFWNICHTYRYIIQSKFQTKVESDEIHFIGEF